MEVMSQDGTLRIIGYRPVTQATPVYVSAGLSTDVAFADVNRATIASIVIMAVGVVLALIAANIIGVAFIIRPIEQIIDVLKRWASGDTGARPRMVGKHGEVGLVDVAIDDLLDELDRREAARKKAEDAKELVTRELSHRVKNTLLSIIQVIARQTFKRLGSSAEFTTFSQRMASLLGAYDVMLSGDGNEGKFGTSSPGRLRLTTIRTTPGSP